MDSNTLRLLYKQIKEGQLSNDEAASQLKLIAKPGDQKIIPVPSMKNAYHIAAETYRYDEPFLQDHTIFGEQVLIGMTHGSLAINAYFEIFPEEQGVQIHRLNFVKPIEVSKNEQVEVLVDPAQKGNMFEFQVLYRYGRLGSWQLTATGEFQKVYFTGEKINIENVKASLQELHDFDYIYANNPAAELGDSFRTITQLHKGQERVLARIALKQTSLSENHSYLLHPLIIHSAYVAVSPLLESLDSKDSFLPFGIKDIYFRRTNPLEECWLLVDLVKNSGEIIIFDAYVLDDSSTVVARILGCSIKRLRFSQDSAGDSEKSDMIGIPRNRISSDSYHAEALSNSQDISAKIQKYLIGKLGKIMPDTSRLSNIKVNLMDLGLDSSQLVAITNEIEKETNIDLYPTLFFEYPNIKELTEYFSQHHRDLFSQLLGTPLKHFNGDIARKTVENVSTETVKTLLQPQAPILQKAALQAMSSLNDSRDDIAIIGMSGRFAESSNPDAFWNNLFQKKDLMTEIPPDHWDYLPWYDENREAKDRTYCKWGSFINDVDKFDAPFFGISRREAEWMDPQMRLLLQSIYATGEDAGCISQLRGTNTGVFVGVCSHDYMERIAELNLPVDPYIGTGNSHTVIANRVSFLFDLTGPSMSVDTACSSSLVALHYACQALQNKECNMAFVGGVNLLLSSLHYRYFSSIGALSPTGRCHTFDDAADGYVPGEGIASILLKPLQQAKRDGDHIYAIIKGSAALHGGYTPSLTAPSVAGEENVILKAWENAGIHPETLSYIEAHGTGTKLGDPIEINSLKKAFSKFTNKEQFCGIGSAKASIGHAEGAAGIVGVIKVILQMKYRQIPAMPKFKKLNSYVQLDKSALFINQESIEWKSTAGVPRRAGVNSFGFAGAYAHVVLEEYIPDEILKPPLAASAEKPVIIVLSARKEDRLKIQAQELLAAIQEQQFSDSDLASIAYTLQAGREAMEERLAMVVESIHELEQRLTAFLEDQTGIKDFYRGQVKRNTETMAVFAIDEDLQQAIDMWIAKRKYSNLLDLWVKGLFIEWDKLYSGVKPRRISLPTYPFAKEHYWIPAHKVQPNNSEVAAASEIVPGLQPPARKNLLNPAAVAEVQYAAVSNKPKGVNLLKLSSENLPATPSDKREYATRLLPEQELRLQDAVSQASPGFHNSQAISVETLMEELAESLAEVLAMQRSEIDVEDKFIDLGLDSITGVEWIQAINKRFDSSIAATKVYDYPNIREFTGFMHKELNKNLSSRLIGENNSPLKPSEPLIKLPVVGSAAAPLQAVSEPGRSIQPTSSMRITPTTEALLDELAVSLAAVLSMERSEIDEDEKFIDMGLDSITGVEWIQAINKRYGISIAATKVYDYPCIREFAGFLAKELSTHIGKADQVIMPVPVLSLQEVLQQVHSGLLDIEQADQILQRKISMEG